MAFSLLLPLPNSFSSPPPRLRPFSSPNSFPSIPITKTLVAPTSRPRVSRSLPPPSSLSLQDLSVLQESLFDLFLASPPTWKSAIGSNLVIFLLGSPVLVSGLSASGIGAAFLLGTLTWRAFGSAGFLLVATYFVVGTAATKLKITQKEALGVAEKRQGRRGPGSVIGSSAAGCVCALLSIYGIGGASFAALWQLGFVANFCTKLSDTVSSEIGKAYGRTAYLVTTFKVVPRGTEGAVSVEGTVAGLLASIFLGSVGYFLGEVDIPQVAICVVASQIANFGESLIGAALQDKEGFQWLNNDVVNVLNISIGSILAVVMQQFMLGHWHP
ncbi:protein VTE6, chloroplastic [Typha angustifolia]|uniref:protein VTE6, chloroplastic n=1 Tax=Typha angustifolia TaxID=59011 RepID=UPI003C308054